jgi:hypothetical protein
MEFVSKLKEMEGREGMGVREFARHIGTSRTMWSDVRAGKKRPGRKFILGALSKYPELASSLSRDAAISDVLV